MAEHYLKTELYRKVREEPALFDFLQEGSLDGIWYWDLENPQEEWMSPRFKALFGYGEDELPDSSSWWRENVFAADRETAEANLRLHWEDPSSAPFDQIVRYLHRDGSTIWVRCRGLAIRDEAGKPIRMLGAHTDLTALKRAEERYRAIHEAFAELELKLDRTGRVVSANREMCEVLGYSLAELIKLSLQHLGEEPDSLNRLLEVQSEVIQIISLRSRTSKLLPLNATVRSCDGGDTVQLLCRDISHLHRLANLEVLLESLPQCILLVDAQSRIVSANQKACVLLGSGRNQLLGTELNRFFVDGMPTFSQDTFLLIPARKPLPVEIALSSLLTLEGSLTMVSLGDITQRKGMEDALRESEQHFRQLTDCLPQLVWTCRPDGHCDFFSQRWLEYTGATLESQLGHGWVVSVHPDDLPEVLRRWKITVATARDDVMECRLRRHDGVYRWFDTRIHAVVADGAVVRWYGSNTDIEDSRALREALREEKERFGRIADTAPGVIFTYHLATSGKTSFTYCSPGIQELFGLDAQTLRQDGDFMNKLTVPEDSEMAIAARTDSMRDQTSYFGEFRYQHPERGKLWIEARSKPSLDADGSTSWSGFFIDSTERKAKEEALRDSQARLMAALSAGRMGTWTWEFDDDRVSWDHSLAALMGHARGAPQSGTLQDFLSWVDPVDLPAVRVALLNTRRSGEELELSFRAAGSQRSQWFSTRGRCELDKLQRPCRFTGVCQDITEQIEAQKRRVQSQKLEALGTLAGGIAHDLNNALAVILGNLKLATEELPGEHPLQRGLEEIDKAGARAADLVRGILTFSRMGEAKREVIHLGPEIEQALRLLRATLPARVEIVADVSHAVAPVKADVTQLHQILMNLCTNSAHAIGARSGTIVVTLQDVAEPAQVHGLRPGRAVCLSVKDDGCGIEPATLQRIFDPFFTTKAAGEGTGLGLSVVHGIVKNHEGAIGVTSEVGAGSEFKLYFPACKQLPQSPPAAAKAGLVGDGERILYVDDETAIVTVATLLLRRLKYEPVGFNSPVLALRAVAADPLSFDAVLTDLSMPAMTGIELTAALRAIRPDLPIALISGYVSPEDERASQAAGATEILLKPLNHLALAQALSRLLKFQD